MKNELRHIAMGLLLALAAAALCGCNRQSASTNLTGTNAARLPSTSPATNTIEVKTNMNNLKMKTNAANMMK